MPRQKTRQVKRAKPPKVKDVEILDDGCIIVDIGIQLFPQMTKVLITPEAILALAEEYANIPPFNTNDFPGIPMMDYEDIFKGEPPKPEGEKT